MLRRITLDIAAGDFVTVLGPSGAGKSTLLSVIGMLDVAWTGEYFLNDEAVHKLDGKKPMALHKEQIGLVFQQYHLLDDLTVAENLDVPLSYRDIRKSERQAIVGDTLDRFGMVAKKDLYPSQLSGEASSSWWASPGPSFTSRSSCLPTSLRETCTRRRGAK